MCFWHAKPSSFLLFCFFFVFFGLKSGRLYNLLLFFSDFLFNFFVTKFVVYARLKSRQSLFSTVFLNVKKR